MHKIQTIATNDPSVSVFVSVNLSVQSHLLYDRFIYLSLRLSNDMDVFWML